MENNEGNTDWLTEMFASVDFAAPIAAPSENVMRDRRLAAIEVEATHSLHIDGAARGPWKYHVIGE